MSAAVELRGVSYRYPGTASGVADVSLEIAPGELVAVIGPSGCGKSTLLKLIAGFLHPDAGDIFIGGADAAGLPPPQREVGVVFQSYALFPHMSAQDNVAYPLRVRGIPRRARAAAAGDMLMRVSLADKSGYRPAQLSGGQQQRVALARALVFKPRALLLDEPLSALDAALRVGMRDEIRSLQREHAIATLHITHDQEEALSMADRVAVMRDGRLLQVGSPKEVYERPVDAAVAAFVGRANLWPGRVLEAGTVDTPLGPLQLTPGHGFAPGAAATVMVRPESVVPGRAPEGVNQFAGRLVRDRFLGSLRRYDFDTARGVIAGETAGPGVIEVVHIPPAAVRLLPPAARPFVQPHDPGERSDR
jgi:putative spermidine/putrescine transport system ATP-binding protein